MPTPQPVNHPLDPSWRLMADVRPIDIMTNWVKQLKSGDNDSFLGTVETYLPGNTYVNNGQLVLEARNTGGGHIAGGTYTSGCVTSYNCFSWLYGYYEVVAQLPAGAGMWPALWMLYTTNAATNEIDLCELVVTPTIQNAGVHFPGGATHDGGAFTVPDMSAGHHAYAVDWNPAYVRCYFDGQLQFQTTISGEIPSAFMYALLNIQIGGNFGNGLPGSPPFTGQTWPQQMRVNSVRLWQPDISPYALNTTITPVYASYAAAIASMAPVAWYPLSDAVSSATAVDLSGNNHAATVTGTVAFGTTGCCVGDTTTAVSFAGGGYLAVPNAVSPTGLSAYSISCLFRMPISQSTDGRLIANGHTDAGGNGMELMISANLTGGLGAVAAASGTDNIYWGSALALSTNYHYAITYDGTHTYVYLNGVQVGNGTASGAIVASGFPFNIGRGGYGNDAFNGVIQHAAFFTYALTPAQVASQAQTATQAPMHAWSAAATVTALTTTTSTVTLTY